MLRTHVPHGHGTHGTHGIHGTHGVHGHGIHGAWVRGHGAHVLCGGGGGLGVLERCVQPTLGGDHDGHHQGQSALPARQAPSRAARQDGTGRKRPPGHRLPRHEDVAEGGEQHTDGREHRGPYRAHTPPSSHDGPHPRILGPLVTGGYAQHPLTALKPRRVIQDTSAGGNPAHTSTDKWRCEAGLTHPRRGGPPPPVPRSARHARSGG
ncbi:hypothetical protein EAO75_26685 [Streptomyces sp. uw30]|nr:hypothetical protein EAO75_26685 [Streptomyces sp. uw30]